ncbi:hypothetical protein VFPPC_13779 [Pochonia chlamydosporia 170]|uniref:Uncharacterized protein n=1 Tax=Pochonia chlamydosporia 170 TaxID=1380566 RepID=A0A179FVN8_METCM|nr:hypothetical protein VFPPC_13779 [Pochonia chlamydosporia 170]OAQ69059.1 hypothetical protein VFPPC_13779 [Pochonia chlamydosporia 170]
MDTVSAGIYQNLQLIELYNPEGQGLAAHWNEFYPTYFAQVSEFARTYVADQVRFICRRFGTQTTEMAASVLLELDEIEDRIPKLKYKFED